MGEGSGALERVAMMLLGTVERIKGLGWHDIYYLNPYCSRLNIVSVLMFSTFSGPLSGAQLSLCHNQVLKITPSKMAQFHFEAPILLRIHRTVPSTAHAFSKVLITPR